MPRTTPRGNVITGKNKKSSSQKTVSKKSSKSSTINPPALTETIHNLIAAAKSEQDKKSSTSKSVNFRNTIQSSSQEEKVANIINKIKTNGILSPAKTVNSNTDKQIVSAPSLSETIKNLSNAAKKGSTTQNTPVQNISIPLFDNHQPVKNEGGNLSSANKSNSVLSRGILGASKGNEAATIKNNTTGRTFINSRGETVKVDTSKSKKENDKEYQEGLKKATQFTAEDNPLIGAGTKKSVSTSTQADINNFVQNWDSIPTEQRAAVACYIAYNTGITNENRSAIMDAYNNSTGQDKINILNAILYKSGQTAETQKMINALSPSEQKLLVDSASASVYGENTLSNQIKGQAAIAPYMAAVTQSRADAYEQEWAKKNYTAADVYRDTIARNFNSFGAANNDNVGFTAADVVTNDRELTSPLHGVDLVKNDLLTNATAIEKNFINFFMDTIENAVDAGGNIYGGDTSKIADDISKKIVNWGTNLNKDYRRESEVQQIRADAINLTETEKIINNVVGYVTQMAPVIALSAINPNAGLAALGTTSGGQYARQAYDSGASLKDSVTYGIMGGLGEALTEKMTTGFGWFGKGIANTVASKTGRTVLSDSTREILEGFKKSATGQALEFFIHAGAEATEEMTMQVLQSYMQRATYDPDAQNATMQEILSAGGYGAVVSGILGLPATALGVTSAVNDKANNQAYQQAIKETAAAQISNIQELLKNNQITPEQAKYSIEEINNAAQKSIDALSGKGNISAAKPVKQEYKKTSNYMQVATDYKEAFTMLKQLAEGKKPGDQVSVALIENGTVKIDTAIVGKYGVAYVHQRLAGPNESNAFKHKAANIIDAKGNEVRQSGLQNNLTESVISLAEHLEKESGKKVRFLSEAAYEQNGKKYTKQGHQDNDTIYLNADSTNPSAQIFSHELTHALKRNNKQYDFFKNYVFDNYKNSLEDERARIYGVYSRAGIDLKTMDDVDDEVLARFVEKKLLTDEETIKNVIKKNRSFAQKVIDWLNDTIQRIFGTKEERFLVDARNLYRKLLDADRAANIKVSEKSETEEKTFDVKYSVEEKKDIRHIKEQIRDNLDVLNKMEPVANVEKEPFQNLKAKENITEILQELKPKGYEIDRKDFGIINFGPNEISRGWDYVSKDAEALSFFAVHNVLKRGVEIHSIVDHKDRRYSSVTFAAPVIINGKRGNLAIAVIQTKGNHYRAHRILAPDGMALMLDKKTSTELTPGEGGRNAVFSPISSVLDTTVSQKDDGVKGEDKQKFSVTENSEYTDAVEVNEEGMIRISDKETIPLSQWSKISNAMKRLGYDIRGAEDAKELFGRGHWLNEKQSKAIAKILSISVFDEEINQEEYKNRGKRAAKLFGTTNDFREAGYLTINGSLLDFSGKKEGGPRGTRSNDHREIEQIFEDKSWSDALIEFMNEGNIRLLPEGQGVDLSMEPNKKQDSILRRYFDVYNGEVVLDVSALNGDNTFSVEYPLGTSSNKIINDIHKYFQTGEEPYISEVQKFRYSITEDSEGRELTADQKEFFKNSKVVDKKGRLSVLYHNTNNEFTVFDIGRSGDNQGSSKGQGIYLSKNKYEFADEAYGKNQMVLYAKITNPFDYRKMIDGFDPATAKKIIQQYDDKKLGENHPHYQHLLHKLTNSAFSAMEYIQYFARMNNVSTVDILSGLGYDGIIDGVEVVAFNPNQVKSTDNLHPTENKDIRYSIEEEPTKENPEMQSILDDLEKLDDQERTPQKVSTMPVVSRVLKKPVPYLYEGKELGEWTGRSYSEGYTHKLEFKWLDDSKKEWLTENELINKIKDHEASRKKDYPVKPEEFYVPGDEVYVGKDLVTIDKGKTRKEGGVMYTVEYADGQKVEVPGTSLSVVPSNGSAVLLGLKNSDIEVKTQMKNILTGLKKDLGFRTKGRKELNDQIISTAQKIMIRGFYNPSDVTRLLDSAYKTGVEQQPLEDVQIAAKDHLKGTRIYVTDDIRGEMNILGGMKEINRKMFGNDTRLTIKRDGAVGLDDLYSELNTLYPDVFPDSIDPTDQLQLIMDAATAKKRERSFEDIDNELLRNDVPEESTIKGEMKQNIEAAFQQLSALYDQYNTELDNYREIPPENSEPEEYPSFEDLREAEKIEWDNPPEGWDVVDGYEVPIETSEPPPEEPNVGTFVLPGNQKERLRMYPSNEENPMESAEMAAMLQTYGDQIKERSDEEIEMDWAWVRNLTGGSYGDGISFGKHYARNFDAAAYNNPANRKKLKDLFETPFVTAKGKYINEVQKMLNDMYDVIHELHIKMGSREDKAIQKYGEGRYLKLETSVNPITNKKIKQNVYKKYTLDDLKKECPLTWENVVKADEYFRRIYDEYIPKINSARMDIYGNVVEAHQLKMKQTKDQVSYNQNRQKELNAKRETINITIASKKEMLKTTKTAKARDILEKSIRYNEDRLVSLKEQIDHYKSEVMNYKSVLRILKEEEKNKEYLKNKLLLPKKDYYHHMRDEASFLYEVLNIGRNTSEIDPTMEGISEFTRPKSRWSSILAHQGKGDYKLSAIESMLEYVQAAEYMIYIDPVTAKFRDNINAMAQATQDTKNINKLILWLHDWVNDLAGKTNVIDRFLLNSRGRNVMRIVRAINSRAKGNAVVANLNSAVVQFSNLPNAFKYVKNPKAWGNGLQTYAEWLFRSPGAKELIRQSTFLNERYLDKNISRFNEKWFQQPEKLGAWMLTVGDQQTSVLIWCASYRDAIKKGEENPIQYADDITQRSVAGRGIGEIPLVQKSIITQIVAPFQVEVNNAWQLYKESTKDILKGNTKRKKAAALDGFIRILIGNFVVNTATDLIIHRRVLWDPIYILLECIREWLKDDDDKDKDKDWAARFKELLGHELGGLISAIPYGSLAAYYLINSQWDRTDLFGEDYDPTRYGVGSIAFDWAVDWITDKDGNQLDNIINFITTFITPFGGKQLERIINGLQNEGVIPKITLDEDGFHSEGKVSGVYDNSGKLKFPMETFASDPYQAFIGLLMGQYATESGQEYVDNDYSALNERETQAYNDLVENGADSFEVYETIRAMKACENDTDKREVLIASDLTDDEKYGLYLNAVISAKSADNERLDINTILGSSLTIDDYFKIRNEKYEIGKSDVDDASTAFSEWVDSQGYTSKQQEAISKTFGSLTKYDSLTAAGLDSATAAQVSKVLSALEPLAGEDNVSSLQRYEAIAGMDLDEDQKNAAMSTVMTAKQYKAYSIGTEYGVTTQVYVDYKNALTTANTDGNNGYSQDETKAAIDTLNISSSAKAALWQMTNKGWKAANNPYNTSVSSAVQEKLKTEEEEPEKTDADMCPLAGEYTVSSWYGYRNVSVGSKYHRANDLACPVGTPVISVKNGTVTSISNKKTGYGISIEITDEDGNVEKYSHLSSVGMEVGDTVAAGTQIAESGNTGTTTGPHLDFKYMKDGQWVDPSLYFNIGEGSGTETATGGYAAKDAATGGTSASSSGGSGTGSGSSGNSGSGSGSSKTSVSSAIDTTKHDTTKNDTAQVASDKYSNVATLMPDGRILLPKYGNTIILPRYTSQSGYTAATAATASTAATSPTGESGMTETSNPSWKA